MSDVEQLIGYGAAQVRPDAPRLALMAARGLREVSEPTEFGEDYPQTIKDQYELLINEGNKFPSDECVLALSALQDRAAAKTWKTLDMSKPKQRETFAKALNGLRLLASGQIGDENFVMDPSMMGPHQRELYFARITYEMMEKLGLNKDFDSDYLLALIGDIATINPHELGNITSLMGRDFAMFDGKFTDEMLVLMDAFGGGKEGGTYTSLMALSDISKMSAEEYGGFLAKLNPNELFFLAHMPFVVTDESGLKIPISIAEVTDFLRTPEGKKYFRMPPHEQAKYGISEYIKHLGRKYPRAAQGLTITSDYSIANTEGGGKKWRKAEVLDEGKRGLVGLSDVHVRMGENPTWLNIMKIARANVNALENRGVYYRGGAVFGLGPELQKWANAYPFYLEEYTNYDGWTRLNFPRFRSMGEYLAGSTDYFGLFKEQRAEGPDVFDPFHPREFSLRNGGIEQPAITDKNLRMNNQLDILSMFYAVEEDPADVTFEEAVAVLVARGSGRCVDYIQDVQNITALTQEQQITLAWQLKQDLDAKLLEQTNIDDDGLENLQLYRTFYPLPPEVIKSRLEHVPQNIQDRLAEYGFKGLVVRYGGPGNLPDEAYKGVSGMKLVAKYMGSGIWSLPKYGSAQKNAPIKHANYEMQMAEIYKLIVTMGVGATQAKSGEAEEEMQRSLAYGKQDLNERTTQVLDKLVSNLRGIQAIPSLRAASWEEFAKAYGEAIQKCGFMTGMRGVWWLYRFGCKQAEYMAGFASTPPYLSGSLPYREVKGEKHYNAVTPGQSLAKYKSLYNLDLVSDEALAILGCYKDNGEIVYPARAAALHPIAMTMDGGNIVVDQRKVNIAAQFDHRRQLPKSPKETKRLIVDAMFDVIKDLKIDVKSSKTYYEF